MTESSRPRRSIDGILSDGARAVPRLTRPAAPVPHTSHPSQRTPAAQTPKSPSRPLWRRVLGAMGQVVLFTLLLVLGLLIQSAVIGQLAIFLYAIATFVFKISSRLSFFLVLGCFMVILVASARSDVTLATTFAMYAFLLLIIATISLAREVRSEI